MKPFATKVVKFSQNITQFGGISYIMFKADDLKIYALHSAIIKKTLSLSKSFKTCIIHTLL